MTTTYPDLPGSSQPSNDTVKYKPSAPPSGYIDTLPGYEGATFDTQGGHVAPPPYEFVYPEVFPMRPPLQTKELTEAEAREAHVSYASSYCCYGKKAAENCVITSIENSSAYHYCLETFAEGRKSNWKFDPYEGEAIPPFATAPPYPWAVPVTDFTYFQDSNRQIQIPETITVKDCHGCEGKGQCKCPDCGGWGKINCSSCDGRGHSQPKEYEGPRQCELCKGFGKKVCPHCSGHDRITCKICRGRQKLKYYIELEVNWKNFKGHHVVERSRVLTDLIKGVTGNVIFQEELPQVAPISSFSEPQVNIGSAALHSEQISEITKTHRIVRQRHTLSIVPVSKVNYNWQGSDRYFFVYGNEKKAFDPDYPEQCCCGLCTII